MNISLYIHFTYILGKHVHVKAPPNSGSEFHNFKDHFSVVLMGLCDADLQFTYVSVGEMGSSSDSSVFRRCGLHRLLQNTQLNLPSPSSVRGSNQTFPYAFVGDAAFPLRPEIMTPFSRRGPLTEEESHFNKELSRARISIENAFGVLTARWRIMRKICELQPETYEIIILACVTLHNFILQTGRDQYIPDNFIDRMNNTGEVIPGEYRRFLPEEHGLIGRGQASRDMTRAGLQIRENIKQFLYDNR